MNEFVTLQCVKTEIYRWRLSSELKADLERQAHLRRVPVSSILNGAVRHWLRKNKSNFRNEAAQRRLHASAALCFGAFAGSDSRRAEKAGANVRWILSQKSR
jgi:hypothetical protein